jgi:O-acetyl-ADP-ribose deacetylase (regulator of RNase III)
VIRYVVGDATKPSTEEGVRVVCHVCNNVGAWGAGFVLAVSRRWAAPEAAYLSARDSLPLGKVQIVDVGERLCVANLIAQDGFPTIAKPCALDYGALAEALARLAQMAGEDWSFHMPRMGAGIAGGKWDVVASIIEFQLSAWPVTVYDLPGAPAAK